MGHVFDPRNLHKLDSPERKRILPAKQVLLDMGLKPGSDFLDFGAGAGYFSFPAADISGERGSVTAADISDAMLAELSKRAENEPNGKRIKQLKLGHPLSLPDDSYDFILLSFVLHEIEDRNTLLSVFSSALRINGIIAVIEWQKKRMETGPEYEDRLSEEETKALLQEAGFTLIAEKKLNPAHYFVTAFSHQ